MVREGFDVIVLGAGPAGGALATRMARGGYRVLLLEKKTFPREKVCGCCYSAATREELLDLGLVMPIKVNTHLILQQRQKSLRIALDDSFSVARSELDNCIANMALEAGVHFLQEHSYFSHEVTATGVIVRVRNRGSVYAFYGKILINAMGLPVSKHPNRNGLQTTVPLKSQQCPGDITMNFRSWGYFGTAVLPGNILNVAAAVDKACILTAKIELEQFCARYTPEAIRWNGTPALRHARTRVFAQRMFFVGDAAAYHEPLTGEGVAWALKSARKLIPYVEQSLQQGWSEKFGRAWQDCYNKEILCGMRSCKLLTSLAYYPHLVSFTLPLLKQVQALQNLLMRKINLRRLA